jgi:hypothetical protein
VANDKLTIGERCVRLPLIGRVAMKESMRFAGTVKGASVSRDGTRWVLAVQVDLDVCWLTKVDRRPVVGVDLNVNEIGCSNGKQYEAPRPLKKAQRRLAKLQRSVSRKVEAQKKARGLSKKDRLPKGTRIVASKNREKASRMLADQHRASFGSRHCVWRNQFKAIKKRCRLFRLLIIGMNLDAFVCVFAPLQEERFGCHPIWRRVVRNRGNTETASNKIN